MLSPRIGGVVKTVDTPIYPDVTISNEYAYGLSAWLEDNQVVVRTAALFVIILRQMS
jgi:hypothetical protein